MLLHPYSNHQPQMELLAENEKAILLLTDRISLISSSIAAFQINYSPEGLTIDVHVTLAHSFNLPKFLLRFDGVTGYQFCWDSSHYFYNIRFCKLFVNEPGYYCSFDPFDESEQINDRDNDWIIAKAIQVYID